MLTTERLRLRPVRADDRSWLYVLQTDDTVREFLGGARNHDRAERTVDAMMSARWGEFVVEGDDGERAGVLALDDARRDLEISYVFHPSAWGRGLAAESLEVLLPWAACAFRVTSVIAVTQAANLRSLHLLERCGFAEEKRFIEYDEPQIQLRWNLGADH